MVWAINITKLNPSSDENLAYRSILCDFTWNLWLSQKGMRSEPFCSSSINAVRQIHPSSQQQCGIKLCLTLQHAYSVVVRNRWWENMCCPFALEWCLHKSVIKKISIPKCFKMRKPFVLKIWRCLLLIFLYFEEQITWLITVFKVSICLYFP